MNLTHLRYLLEVEKTGSITKAAQNLFMGQPNLSKAIKDMEREMGIIVFKRTAKGVEPTKKGEELLEHARRLVNQADEFENLYKNDKRRQVRLSITVPRATYCSIAFSRFMNSLAAEEKIAVEFHEADAMSAISLVAGGEVDIAVIRCSSPYEDYFLSAVTEHGLEYKPLAEFKMELLMSEKHPLAAYETVPYSLLADYTEIRNGDYEVRTAAFSKIKREAELPVPAKTINIYDRGSQYDLLTMTAGTYMWVSPIEKEYLKLHGLVTRPCDASDSVGSKDYLIHAAGYKLSDYEQRFIDAVLKESQAQ